MKKTLYNSTLLKSCFDHLRSWPAKKKIFLGLAVFVGLLTVVFIFQSYRDSGYQLLYGSLKPDEMSAISHWLENRHIDYKKEYKDGNIYVPAESAHKTRTELAEQRSIQYPGTGHQLTASDNISPFGPLGSTSSTIALQRELARTISAFDHIRSAQVHLNFRGQQGDAVSLQNATIVLSYEPGRRPVPDQLQAMSRIVSGAFAGLPPDRIRIISSNGKVLLRGGGIVDDRLLTSDSLSYQRSLEQMLEKRAADIIEMILGTGSAHVTVAADLDFGSSEMIEERFDPDQVVIRKEETSQQIKDGNNADPGTLNSYQDAYAGTISSDSKLEYEINKTTSKTSKPTGTVDGLTVTLLVPDQTIRQSDNGSSYAPVSSELTEKIKAAVSAALALKPERGDTIHLIRIPVIDSRTITATAGGFAGVDFFNYLPLARFFLYVILLLLAYLLLMRPILSVLKQQEGLSENSADLQETPLEKEPVTRSEDTIDAVKQQILSNPATAAHIVRKWIKEA